MIVTQPHFGGSKLLTRCSQRLKLEEDQEELSWYATFMKLSQYEVYVLIRRHRYSTEKFGRVDARLHGQSTPATSILGSPSLKVKLAKVANKL